MENKENSLAEIIAKIQDEVGNIKKDSQNPHFKNTYASYEQVLEVLNPILRKYNLVIYHGFGTPIFENQIAVTTEIVNIDKNLGLTTTLYIPITKLDPQMAGSAITYAKRYSILAMLGLGTEDDDGEGAVRPKETKPSGTITREPVVDDTLIHGCNVHQNPDGSRVVMTLVAKNGNYYHIIDKGVCFGKGIIERK